MTTFINDEIARQVKEVFDQLTNPVELLYFGQQTEGDEYCAETLQLLEEVVALSNMINMSIYDLDQNTEQAHQYKVDKAPGFVIAGKDGDHIIDYGIRYYGIPSGHEFTSLINDLVMVSSRNSALSEPTRQFLKNLTQPVHLQVFVTPTCQYCPRAVVLAHQMALESPYIEAEMVDTPAFFDLANQYDVSGVPHTVINHGAGRLVGAAPEEDLVKEIQKVLQEQVEVSKDENRSI